MIEITFSKAIYIEKRGILTEVAQPYAIRINLNTPCAAELSSGFFPLAISETEEENSREMSFFRFKKKNNSLLNCSQTNENCLPHSVCPQTVCAHSMLRLGDTKAIQQYVKGRRAVCTCVSITAWASFKRALVLFSSRLSFLSVSASPRSKWSRSSSSRRSYSRLA